MTALAIFGGLAPFAALLLWRARVEQGWVGLTDYDRRVLRLRLAILHMEEVVARAFLPAIRHATEVFARAKPIFDALNEQMLADPEGRDGCS